MNLVRKAGAWYTFNGEQLGQGRENAKQFLAEHPEIMVEINELVRQKIAPDLQVMEEETTEGELTQDPNPPIVANAV